MSIKKRGRIQRVINNPLVYLRSIILRIPFLSDEQRIKIMWKRWMNYPLNLKTPTTFNEKLQWMKLNDRNPLYTTLVDKYAVKDYVRNIIGDQYIIPTLAVWDTVEDIDLSVLPKQFVLKTTHDSGGVCICRDKDTFDFDAAKEKLNRSLHYDYYKLAAEWPYKNVPRRIIAEEYLEDRTYHELRDYKFFCFDGVVNFFKIDFNRQTNHRANYYDRNGMLMPFGEAAFPPDPDKKLEIPSNLQEMIRLAERLSQKEHFCRIDLYNIKEKIYFGEITLYPASGLGKFTPDNFDEIIGKMLILPEKRMGGIL